jgi:hypothetical protein
LTVLRGRARPFAAITVLSGFATLGALNVGNPELMIARVNLARTPDARGVDYEYLTRLSGDAAPAVVRALQLAPPSAEACKGATALRKKWVRVEDVSWNLGARLGRGAVEQGLLEEQMARLCAGSR